MSTRFSQWLALGLLDVAEKRIGYSYEISPIGTHGITYFWEMHLFAGYQVPYTFFIHSLGGYVLILNFICYSIFSLFLDKIWFTLCI